MANKQSIESYKLGIEMTSKEGVHDFISMLEAVIEDIKGGLEKRHTRNDHNNATMGYRRHSQP